ncbi:MAG: hypothetical protein RR505_13195 [Raoultibacter sp.]
MTQETTKAINHHPKQIRFMDSHCRFLFSIQNGDSITITSKNGKRTVAVHDFAEKMYQRGATYMPTIPLYLPE